MRVHLTPHFQAVRSAHCAAYASWSEIASRPAPWDADQEAAEMNASAAEDKAMERLVAFPALTPAEIAAKLAFIREREAWEWNIFPDVMAQIERELVELQRPRVSPAMEQCFNEWRDAYEAFFCEVDSDETMKRHGRAFIALMEAPCVTPGDFIVKVYANMLGEHGSTSYGPDHPDNEPGAFHFEVDDALLDEGLGTHDGAAEIAFNRDISECDLGRCLLALGRVDFDAGAWLEAAQRAGMSASVVVQSDGSKQLWVAQPHAELAERGAKRAERCQALLGAGMGVIGAERCAALIAYLEQHQPRLVHHSAQALGSAT